MDAPVQIVCFGEVLEGFDPSDAKRRVGHLLKLDDARVAQLFSGVRTVLKRSVAMADAQRYADLLAKVGVRVHLEPSRGPSTPAPNDTKPSARLDFPAIQMPPDAPPPAASSSGPPKPAPIPAAVTAAPAPALEMQEPARTQPGVDEVTCPKCGERQPKRLLCRACTTNIEMAVADKAERENSARQARQEALLARQAARAGASRSSSGPGIFGFGLTGRMGRFRYATATTWTWALLLMLAIPVLQKATAGRIVFAAIGVGILMLISWRHAVLRCHDCDKSGWWTLFALIPATQVVLSLILAFAPGTDGENDYGEQPPRQTWGLLAVGLLVLALAFALSVRAYVRMLGTMTEEEDGLVQFETFDPHAQARLSTPEQQNAFYGEYAGARSHKAFAVSSAGAWGMSSGAATQAEALRAAALDCESRRLAYTAACQPVNLDGQWAQQ